MARGYEEKDRRWVLRLLALQCGMTFAVSTFGALFGYVEAWSALAGGFAAVIPNGVVVWGAFAPYQAGRPGAILGRLYMAQTLKLMLAGLFFAAVFSWLHPLSVVAFFAAFITVYLVPLLLNNQSG